MRKLFHVQYLGIIVAIPNDCTYSYARAYAL